MKFFYLIKVLLLMILRFFCVNSRTSKSVTSSQTLLHIRSYTVNVFFRILHSIKVKLYYIFMQFMTNIFTLFLTLDNFMQFYFNFIFILGNFMPLMKRYYNNKIH